MKRGQAIQAGPLFFVKLNNTTGLETARVAVYLHKATPKTNQVSKC